MATTTYNYQTKAFETANEGCVLAIKTQDVQIMSDVWDRGTFALVWNAEKMKPESIFLAYAYEGDRKTNGSAVVDATPEVLAAYRDFRIQREIERITENEKTNRRAIVKDAIVKVVSGRNNKGLVGPVVAMTVSDYRTGYSYSRESKVAIALDDTTTLHQARSGRSYTRYANVAWVWARNCERQNLAPIDLEKVRAEAIKTVDSYPASW